MSQTKPTRAPKRKYRRYSDDYLQYGFIASYINESLPMCLVCEKNFSNDSMKPSKMKEHMLRVHPDMVGMDIEFFQTLKEKISYRMNWEMKEQETPSLDNVEGLRVSYRIALNIVKNGYPCSLGKELLLPAIKDVIEVMMKKESRGILSALPMETEDLQKRIEEMASDVEKTLVLQLQLSNFSIQFDVLRLSCSNILMAYVKYFNTKLKSTNDEFLFAKYLDTDITSEMIFQSMDDYFQKHSIPCSNITAVGLDGDSSMEEIFVQFKSLAKERIPEAVTLHTVLHRQHFLDENLGVEMFYTFQTCCEVVNKIKDNMVNCKVFSMLNYGNSELVEQLLVHSPTAWLARADSIQKIVNFYDLIVEYLQETDAALCDKFKNLKSHIYYIADLFSSLNEIEVNLHGDDITIIQTRLVVASLQLKLCILKSCLENRDFKDFTNLALLASKNEIKDGDLSTYKKHIEKLSESLKVRFESLEEMAIPNWILKPFETHENAPAELQEEINLLNCDIIGQMLFQSKNLGDFWRNINMTGRYPLLSNAAESFILALPGSNTAENGLIRSLSILAKQKNVNMEECCELRLSLTKLQPNIIALVSSYKAHCSKYAKITQWKS